MDEEEMSYFVYNDWESTDLGIMVPWEAKGNYYLYSHHELYLQIPEPIQTLAGWGAGTQGLPSSAEASTASPGALKLFSFITTRSSWRCLLSLDCGVT